jgi:transcriptional regulator with XRE-family HTH domain
MSYIVVMYPDNRIRELRKKVGLTQAELGDLVGLHQTQVGNLENGARTLTLEWGRRIAKVLGVTMADLLPDEDNPDRLGDDERALVSNYRKADPVQRAIVERAAEPFGPNREDRQVA